MDTTARFGFIFVAIMCAAPAAARGLYANGFDPPFIEPLFPQVDGEFQLPSGATSDQLAWLLSELAAGETTTIAEVNEHFDASWLSQIPAAQTQTFVNSLRTSFPDAVVTDVVGVTPVRITVVIDSPGSPPPSGFLSIGARYSGARKIVQLGSSNYGGSVQYPEDQTLTMTQAADKFVTLSASPALLVGRIGSNGQCSAIVDRNATQLRATASIFKTWILAGVGRAIAAGLVSAEDPIALVATELAPGGTINSEPLGTVFPLGDLATLMMGISDNTATDLLHEVIGRDHIDGVIGNIGLANPDVLRPILGISEQFHVFRSFDLPTAQSFVNGTEAFQQQFVEEEIVPLGPQTTGPYFHVDLLTSGTWRASPMDICQAFASLRRLPPGSEALQTVDAAFGAGAAQPDVRQDWDRVWYKGGSLAASVDDFHVLTHAWMLENAGGDPYVVIAMSNDSGGGINPFFVQSITGRLLELVSKLP